MLFILHCNSFIQKWKDDSNCQFCFFSEIERNGMIFLFEKFLLNKLLIFLTNDCEIDYRFVEFPDWALNLHASAKDVKNFTLIVNLTCWFYFNISC
jgi:hypothetical protein